MSDAIRTRCPHCQATLTLKSAAFVGRTVPCPRCRRTFVVQAVTESGAGPAVSDDDFGPPQGSDEPRRAAAPPPVVGKRKPQKKRRQTEEEAVRAASAAGGSLLKRLFSVLVWINAHIAVGVCIVDNAIDFLWILTHWNEVYQQAGLGRFAVRQLGRPLLVIVTAGIIWFNGVLFRDIMARGAVVVFGCGYLLLFGVVAFIVGAMAESLYERPIYAIQWSVIYLGASLLAYAAWGYAPETTLQRAERLTSQGRISEALTAVERAMREDPDDPDALELYRSLREMLRGV